MLYYDILSQILCKIGVFGLRTVEERLKSYEPLWENWTYTGEFLGEGAMSSVFEIQSTAMGFREIAALKIVTVKKNFRGEVQIPENALNEIRILRALSACQNIVQYHDSTQRQIYDENNQLSEIDLLIKMEKLKPLSEGDKLSEEQIVKLAKDMCTALDYASEHKIIHRDIKPQNIFVDEEGTYKLGDFGIAKIVSDFSSSYTMNIGTLAYTAPEVRMSTTGKYDISSDIYSLGMVLYVLLNNGYFPFASTSANLNEAITKRLSGAAFPSPARGSKNLKTIVMRACNNDLAKRYRTPKEMLEDLELLSTGGKKMVVDPFATLDANLDVSEADAVTSTAAAGAGRLKVSDTFTSVPKEHAPVSEPSAGGSRLKIKMKESPKPTPSAPVSGAKEVKAPASASPGGSRLKINMSGKPSVPSTPIAPRPTPPAPTPKPGPAKETKEESTGADSFFKAPDSL